MNLFQLNPNLIFNAFDQYYNANPAFLSDAIYEGTYLPTSPALRYTHFTTDQTQTFITALGDALATAGSGPLPQIRLFITIAGNSSNPYFCPIVSIGKGEGFVITTQQSTSGQISINQNSIPADFDCRPMTQILRGGDPNTGAAYDDPNAPIGSTELTQVQVNEFVSYFRNALPNFHSLITETTTGRRVQHYTFTGPDTLDIYNKGRVMAQPILRCVMGANNPSEMHPVAFRPILELVEAPSMVQEDLSDLAKNEDTYWDFSTPCPPNCAGGN